jgi:dihydrofolate reductase
MRKHFIVTNIDQTVQRVINHQGQSIWISPGKSVLMQNPPKESYTFHIEPLTHESEKIYFEEFKTEGSELKTVAEVKEKQEKINKQKEVKNK